ncbi:hypothetical protein KTN05_17075 [Paracoccus sp. Z118]|nr:hypothetical protein [Paracoccus sp. Z118]
MEDAQEILCQHHALLEDLARSLANTGFMGEEELARRLASLDRQSADPAVAAL